jgi:hypothetical protein
MQSIQNHFSNLHVRATLVRGWNVITSVASVLALLLLIIAWAISVRFEGGQLKRRHGCSIAAFVLSTFTLVINGFALRAEPSAALFYAVEAMATAAMFLTSVSIGMNAIVVDICTAGAPTAQGVHCSAHYLEYAAGFILCVCLGSIFATTQQRLVVSVDRGVLKGLGSRMSKV